MSRSSLLRLELSPKPHFEATDWAIADAFDDFLAEVAEVECATEFVELNGAFVARRFFPLQTLTAQQMERLLLQFAARHKKET